MKRALTVLVVLGLLGLFGWYLYRRIKAAQEPPPERRRGFAVAVEVAPVETGAIRDVGLFTGTLLARSQFIVAPKIGGRLEKLMFNIGDPVTAGQLIAQLDDDEYVQQVGQAGAELKVAQATVLEAKSALDVAKSEFERAKGLYESNVAPKSEYDVSVSRYAAAQAKHQVALAQVTQREAALKAAEVRESYAQIYATWQEGERPRVVGERFVDEGAMLRANDPILSILDLTTVTAVIYVIERDYPQVFAGLKAQEPLPATVTTDAYPGRRFPGLVVRVAPLLKETSRQARVEVEVPNPEGLLTQGMFVRVELAFAEHKNATLVPVDALMRREGQEGVFLADLETKTAHFVPVTVGIINGDRAEVLAPPMAGHVVTLGQHLLSEGVTISVPEAASPTTQAAEASTGRGRSSPPGRSGGPRRGGGRS